MLPERFYVRFFHRLCLLHSVRRALASPAREVRAEAIQAAVLLGDKRGVCRALHSSDLWIRTAAVKGLAQLDGVRAARRLARLALTDDSSEVARAAAECLAHLQGPGVVQALQRSVASQDWLVRFFGTRGLARAGSRDVIPLLEKLQSDEHSWVRGEATQALRRLTQGAPGHKERD